MAKKLTIKGGRQGVVRDRKKQEEAEKPSERTTKIRIPLAVDTDELSVHGTVAVAGEPGKDISWTDAEDLLREALKAVKAIGRS